MLTVIRYTLIQHACIICYLPHQQCRLGETPSQAAAVELLPEKDKKYKLATSIKDLTNFFNTFATENLIGKS